MSVDAKLDFFMACSPLMLKEDSRGRTAAEGQSEDISLEISP